MDEKVREALLLEAEQGDRDAQYGLGQYYDRGFRLGFGFEDIDGIPPDIYWYRKAAEQGQVEAQFHLGQHYRRGLGVEKDSKQAAYWFRKAAEQGHERAKDKAKSQ